GRSIRRIKGKISEIIHRHLILYPSRSLFSTARIGVGSLDWDMVTCINEIRRYLYGQVTEADLTAALANAAAPLKKTRSLLSFYPLVTDPTIFRQLDGWLVSAIRRAQKRRKHLIDAWFPNYQLYSEQQIISGTWYTNIVPNETKLPSFFRA